MSEVRREGYKFCQDICVPCYHTDAACYLKPAAFMDMAQEIAYWAAHELGFGYDDLHVHHTAWVLSRLHFHFDNPPKWRDDVTLYTWHKGTDGLFYLRDFYLVNPRGECLVTCTSSWVVIDEQTRRLVRPEELQDLLDTGCAEDAIAERAPKVAMPKAGPVVRQAHQPVPEPKPQPVPELKSQPVPEQVEEIPGQAGNDEKEPVPEPVGEHVVLYSDIDIIGHTNNARYMVWAMDCLDYETVSTRRVRDVYVNFNKETTPGSTVQLFRLKTEENGALVWYVEGRVDGKTAFCVKLVF